VNSDVTEAVYDLDERHQHRSHDPYPELCQGPNYKVL
jgi:hypothetical protein